MTAALNSPARNAIVSGSGSSGQPPNKKRKISEVGAADSQEAAFVPRPKPSILSYGQSLEKAYQVTYLAHKAQMDASKGAATGSRRMDAGSSAAVAAGTVATTSPSPTRRTVSTAVGLLTPAASASNASVSSVASSKPGEGPSQQPEEVPSPSQRKDKGKQRAQDPPPSHVRDSPREATEPASPERPAKKPRVAPFEIHEIDAGAEDTFSSAIDGGSTMEDYGESDGASTGFQMLDFADLLSFPWAFTKVPFDVASMYVPMGTKAAFDSTLHSVLQCDTSLMLLIQVCNSPLRLNHRLDVQPRLISWLRFRRTSSQNDVSPNWNTRETHLWHNSKGGQALLR